MKRKNYKHGKQTYKAYLKPVGKGYEVGLTCSGTAIFVGNFLHSKEANAWWRELNKHVQSFTKKYWITPEAPKSFYLKFLTNHLYKTYYGFLNKEFNRYNKSFIQEFNKSEKKI